MIFLLLAGELYHNPGRTGKRFPGLVEKRLAGSEGSELTRRSYRFANWILLCSLAVGLGVALHRQAAAQGRRAREVATPGPMLAQGTVDFSTPDFDVSLVRSSQTVAALKPKGAGGFDFTPGDLLVERSKNGYYHLGDIDFRLRAGTSGEWKSYSTAFSRTPVSALPASRNILASADLTPTLPADFPLQVTRTWALENGKLVLRFTLKNKTT
ncbi:MAG: DUF5695 domain-containing protein, partial [Candidatus Acidiferrales bacterium]